MSDKELDQKVLQVFGANLVRLREERGWSIDDLANNAGLAVDVVATYERGEASAPLIDLRRLAKAFGIPTSELVEPVK